MLKEWPFTMIADETTDGSNQTQLWLSLRFMNEEGPPKVEERFLQFLRLDACTGEWNLTVFVYKASKTLVLDLCLVKYTENRQTDINFLIWEGQYIIIEIFFLAAFFNFHWCFVYFQIEIQWPFEG